MKRLSLIAACGGLFLASCHGQASDTANSASNVVNEAIVAGDQTFLDADTAYLAIEKIALADVEAGLIKGDAAAKVRVIHAQATDVLDQGKAAADKSGYAQNLLLLIPQLTALLPVAK